MIDDRDHRGGSVVSHRSHLDGVATVLAYQWIDKRGGIWQYEIDRYYEELQGENPFTP